MALLLSVVMLVSMLPVAALATQDAGYTAPVAGATDGADGADGADANAADTDNDGNTVDDTDKTGGADDTDKTGDAGNTDKTGDADDDTDTSADSTTAGALGAAPQVAAVPQPVDVPQVQSVDTPSVRGFVLDLNDLQLYIAEDGDVITDASNPQKLPIFLGVELSMVDGELDYVNPKDMTVTLKNYTANYQTGNYVEYDNPPVAVWPGSNVTLIIDGTVTLYGTNAKGTIGATPAIYVPEDATLTIISAHETRQDANGNALNAPVDTLKVYGGNAAAGGDGTSGTQYGEGGYIYVGGGGNGGGGAAAAIGTGGGTGGRGSARTRYMQKYTYEGTQKSAYWYILPCDDIGIDFSDIESTNGTMRWVDASENDVDIPDGANLVGDAITVDNDTRRDGDAADDAGSIRVVGYLTLEGSGGNAAAGGKGGAGGIAKASVIRSADSKDSSGYNYIYFAFPGCGGGGGGGGGCAASFIGTGGAGGSGGYRGEYKPANTDRVGTVYGGAAMLSDFSENNYSKTCVKQQGLNGGNGGWPNGSGGGGGDGAYIKVYSYTEEYLHVYMTRYLSDYQRQTAGAAEAGCVGNNGSAGFDSDYTRNLEGMPEKVDGGEGGTGAGGVNSATNKVAPTVMTQSPIFSTAVNVANNSVAAGKTSNTAHHSVLVGSGDGYQSGSVTQTAPILLVDLKDCTVTFTSDCSCENGKHKFNGQSHGPKDAYSSYQCKSIEWDQGKAFCGSMVSEDATKNSWSAAWGWGFSSINEKKQIDDFVNVPGSARVVGWATSSSGADALNDLSDDLSGDLSGGKFVYVGYQDVPLGIEKAKLDSIYFSETSKEVFVGNNVDLEFFVTPGEGIKFGSAPWDSALSIETLLGREASYQANTEISSKNSFAAAKGASVSWTVTKDGSTATEGTDYTITKEQYTQTRYFTPLKTGTYTVSATLNLDNFESPTTTTTPLTVVAKQAVTPTITGTPHAGQTLTATLPDGVLEALEADDITVNYRWYDVTTDGDNKITDATEISGATAKTYTVPHNCADGKVAVTVKLAGDEDKLPYYQEDTSDPIAVTAHSYPKATNGKSESGFCTVEVGTSTDTDGNTTSILCDEYEMPEFTSSRDRYKIENGGQLFWFAALTNGDSTHAHMADGLPVSQNLAANAQIAGNKGYYKNMIGRLWTPIAKDAKVENGTLTGGYTGTIELIGNIGLLNVNIDYSEATSDTAPQCVGFIAALGSGGMVKVPSDSSTNNSTTIAKSVKARNSTYVGGLVGYAAADSTIQFLDGTPMQNKFEITADNCGYVGGVVGYSAGTLTNANFAGTITATNGSENIGGVVGYANGATITKPSYSGVITVNGGSKNIGGIAGYSNGAIITDATATGTYVGTDDDVGVYNGYSGIIAVNGTSESVKCKEVGGIVGYATGATKINNATSSVKITGSYLSHVGGVLGAGRGGSVQLSGCLYKEYEKTDAYDWRTVDSNNINVTNTWDSVGGIAGLLEGTMVNSANRVEMRVDTGSRTDNVFVGGLAGQALRGNNKASQITDCYSVAYLEVITTSTAANKGIGGLIGRSTNASYCVNSYYPEDFVWVAASEDALYAEDNAAWNQAIGVTDTETNCPDTTLTYTPCRADGYNMATDEKDGGFLGGEVTYLLNGKTSNAATNAWFQHLDNGWTRCGVSNCSVHIADDYPRLKREFTRTSDHQDYSSEEMEGSSSEDYMTAVVYENWTCTAGYSNSPVPYSVDVTWGSMVFEYKPGTWDPDTHISTGGEWINEYADGRNLITVSNEESERPIMVTFTFTKDDGFNYNLTGTFEHVESADTYGGLILQYNTTYVINPGYEGKCYLKLASTDSIPSTAFKTDGTANKKIGTVTVTLGQKIEG